MGSLGELDGVVEVVLAEGRSDGARRQRLSPVGEVDQAGWLRVTECCPAAETARRTP